MRKSKYIRLITALRKISVLLSNGDKRKIYLTSVLLIISSLVEVAAVASIYPFLQYILNENNAIHSQFIKFIELDKIILFHSKPMLFVSLIYFFIILSSSAFKIFVLKQTGKTIAIASNNLATKIFFISIFGPSPIKSTSQVVSNIVLRCNYAMGALFNITGIISAALLIFGVVYSLFFVNPLITLVGFLMLSILYIVISKFTSFKSIMNGQIIDEQSSAQIAHAKQTLDNAKNIIIENRINDETNHFKLIDLEIRLARFSNQLINNIPRIIIETLIMIAVALFVIYFSITNLDILKIIPMLILFVLAFQKLLPSINSIYTNHTNLLQSLSPINKLADQIISVSQISQSFTDSLVFDEMNICNLGHNDKKTGMPIYKPVTLRLLKGDKLLISGSSGVGKTTIIESMIGLSNPSMGKILINNVKLQDQQLKKWWNSITYIPQSPCIFNNSLKYNITLCSDDAIDDEKYETVCKITRLNLLQNKLGNFLISENGQNLSGGEKQKILLARALYSQRKVLFCDESLNAIDSATRYEILKSIFIKYPDLTMIYISHNTEELKIFNKHLNVEHNL